jgi:hypothetical protein
LLKDRQGDQVRGGGASSRHDSADAVAVAGRALRIVVVAEDLDALRGPLSGCCRLPHHLDASARHLHDFADEQWRELAYPSVLMEAGTEADLTDWLDKNALLALALWPQMYLPLFVRLAWERRHRQLARGGARPHVPPVP